MPGHLVGGGHRVLRGHPLPVLPVRPVCPRHMLASARHPDYPWLLLTMLLYLALKLIYAHVVENGDEEEARLGRRGQTFFLSI